MADLVVRLPAPRGRRWMLPVAFLFAVFLCAAFFRPAYAQNSSCGEPQRTQGTVVLERCVIRVFNNNSVQKKLVVYYTTVNGAASDRLVAVNADGNPANGAEMSADALANQVADWTVDAWRLYRFYGMGDPLNRSFMTVHIFDILNPGAAGWCCDGATYQFQVEAGSLVSALTSPNDPRNAESIVYHEMWHAVTPNVGHDGWAVEGGASHMTDHSTNGIDNDNDNDYMNWLRSYLGGDYKKSLTSIAYTAGIWWQYFSERTSSGTDTLKRGVDSVRAFWVDPAPTDMARMDNIIRARNPGQTFESIWIDFAVTNFAKDYTGVPEKWRYFDETHAGAPDYPAPSSPMGNLTKDSPVVPTLSAVSAWATHYYEYSVAADVPVVNVEVRQDLNRRVAYSLLLINGGRVRAEERYIGRDFVKSIPHEGFDRIVLIVVGLNEAANYRYSINATMGLKIMDPLAARSVEVGNPATPDKMLIKINLFGGPGGAPIAGVDPSQVAITVDGVAVKPADRISAAYIQGQYWLLVRAPVQPSAGAKNLTVTYAGLSDTEFFSVHYGAGFDSSTMVVIDRSASMNDFGKLQAAKDAARLYIDSWNTGDLIGVASFSTDATVNLNLGAFETERVNALNAINGLVGAGETSIGDGAQAGMQNLIDRDPSARPWSIMLLSDGIENNEITIATFLANYNARRNANPAQKVPKVIAVALGPDADRVRMEKLASDTGGVYFVAALPAVAASSATADTVAAPDAINAVPLANDLAEIYRAGSEFVAGVEQIGVQTWHWNNDDYPLFFKFTVDGSASEAVFVVKWDVGGILRKTYLRKPDGTSIFPAPSEEDSRHRVFRVAAPEPGEWAIVIDQEDINAAAPDGLPTPDEVLFEASVSSALTMKAYLGLPVEQRLVGKPMPILASLADANPLPGATVNAFVTAPEGFYQITLKDDGAHGDGAANDGFYGGVFYQTQVHGAYDLVVSASGNGSDGKPFVRRARLGFNMMQSRFLDFDPNFPNYDPNYVVDWNNPNDPNRGRVDKDGDGLVDWWEVETGLDPDNSRANQAGDDPDYDGLSNQDEFDQGTDPMTSDTDHGGQNDGSEVTNHQDPLDASDDLTPCVREFQALSTFQERDEQVYTGAVWLTYDVDSDHKSFSLWRQVESDTRTFVSDQLPATGIYSDTDVTVGTTYHYWLAANDAEMDQSCIVGPVSVKLDPDAALPEGRVEINNGAIKTSSPQVTLAIGASEDSVQMQVRNKMSDFDTAQGWEPLATTKAWTLAPSGGQGVVFVFFRDGAGYVSEPAVDAIRIAGAGGEHPVFLPVVRKH